MDLKPSSRRSGCVLKHLRISSTLCGSRSIRGSSPLSSDLRSIHSFVLLSCLPPSQVAVVATGLQFGWALQLSLLTPYVQLLGIPHAFASYIWLCGPISGMIVQVSVVSRERCSSLNAKRQNGKYQSLLERQIHQICNEKTAIP